MDIHENVRLMPRGREHMVNMVLSGQTPKVGEAVGLCPRTVKKWVDRFKEEGLAGLQDRSSRPEHLRQPTPQAIVDRIEALRRQRLTGKAIAAETGVSTATVSRVLKRLGLNRLSALEPAEPPRRTGHRITGRKTGIATSRGSGWEFVHVCIDDASRIAFSRIMKTERQTCAIAFLKAAIAYYKSLGITVERVMTDNGSCYRSRRFRSACMRLGLKHIYTRPYTKTNGKAGRFIQTALREWAYARAYDTSLQRAAKLPYMI